MSLMDKRLQLLLDRARYARVEAEAERSGRSVAAVIREAIDMRFPGDEDQTRAAAVRFLLATEAATPGRAGDWSSTKKELDRELQAKLPR